MEEKYWTEWMEDRINDGWEEVEKSHANAISSIRLRTIHSCVISNNWIINRNIESEKTKLHYNICNGKHGKCNLINVWNKYKAVFDSTECEKMHHK